MNIKILDSWLREYVKTEATPAKLAEVMSLTSSSIERIEDYHGDKLYEIEITTNRTDLLSVVGLAREAATVLNQFGIKAIFTPPQLPPLPQVKQPEIHFQVTDTTGLLPRICAVVMEIEQKESPKFIQTRLEASDIRSLNNIVDVTNYAMRVIGHPCHVFDYDRLFTNKLTIKLSKGGEKIETLDGKTYTLPGNDIIAVNDKGEIVDLLGIMGLSNSVVTEQTKRIVFFVNTDDPHHIRKTSMQLGIRTEAAQMNEKGIDPQLAGDTLQFAINLYKNIANGKIISNIVDIYPKKYIPKQITLSEEKIQSVIGVPITLEKSAKILESLGFGVSVKNKTLTAGVPSVRAHEIEIAEDIIEEVARIYGYHKLPSVLPTLENTIAQTTDAFYWENKVKTALKHWGFTEVYTYSMVSENLFEGELNDAVTLKNPLSEEWIYLRRTLMPSLLQAVHENTTRDNLAVFEIANVYLKQQAALPAEELHLAAIIKKPKVHFLEAKGILEALAHECGINNLQWEATDSGAEVYIGKTCIGEIEILDAQTIDFEINFAIFVNNATRKKTFTPLAKYPPILEDITCVLPGGQSVGEVEDVIKKQSTLIKKVTLFDKYEQNRTFTIIYQHADKNLTDADIAPIREKIVSALKTHLQVRVK